MPTNERNGIGRKRGIEYNHFKTIASSSKAKKVKCNHCHQELCQDILRMQKHLLKCKNANDIVKREIKESVLKKIENPSPASISIKTPKLSTLSSTPLSDSVLEMFYERMTMAFITSNIPWSFLDNTIFKESLSLLRPNLIHLTAQKASTSMLDKLSFKHDKDCKEFIVNSKYLTLLFDSLTDFTRKNIMNSIVINEENCSFLIDLEEKSSGKSIIESKNDILSIVKEHELDNKAILSLCCNSSGTYFKVCKLLKEEENPFTLLGGCLVYQTNLILKDLIKFSPLLLETIENARFISKLLRNSVEFNNAVRDHLDEALRKELKTTLTTFSIWFPTYTKWYSYGICIKQILRIFNSIKSACNQDKECSYFKNVKCFEKIKRLTEDIAFEDNLIHTDRILSPFNFLTGITEMENISSGQIILTWIWLLLIIYESKLLTNITKEKYKTKFFKRLQYYGESHYLVAMLLDPRVHGVGLSTKGLRRVKNFTLKLHEKLINTSLSIDSKTQLVNQLNDYIKKKAEFRDDGSNWLCIENPMVFWSNYEDMELSKVAKLVLSYVPYLTSFQRNWSSNIEYHYKKEKNTLILNKKISKIKHVNKEKNKKKNREIAKECSKLFDFQNNIQINILFEENKNSIQVFDENRIYLENSKEKIQQQKQQQEKEEEDYELRKKKIYEETKNENNNSTTNINIYYKDEIEIIEDLCYIQEKRKINSLSISNILNSLNDDLETNVMEEENIKLEEEEEMENMNMNKIDITWFDIESRINIENCLSDYLKSLNYFTV